MYSSKLKTINFVVLALLMIVIVVNIGITFAWLTDKLSTESETLKFGTININANQDGWFSSAVEGNLQLNPGDYLIDNDVTFNLGKNSSNVLGQSMYVRAKYKVSTTSTNSEVLKIYDYLKYFNLNLESGSDYSWSEKIGDYYYLLNSSGTPYEINSVHSSDFVFLKKANSQIPGSLSIDPALSNSDTINVSIAIEAIQSAHLNADADSDLITKIRKELNNLTGVVETAGKLTVTFKNRATGETSTAQASYAGSATIPSVALTAGNLTKDSDGIISLAGTSHSVLSGNTMKNITENLTIYYLQMA